jgi:hypothetical protein
MKVFLQTYLHIMIIYLLVGIKYLQFKFKIPAHTYCCMCHYPPVYLQGIPAPISAPVSAPVSAQLHRRLRGLIAVASPHRIASLTSLELHLPVVHWQPTRCTRTEEVEPHQWALDEAMMRTHVEVMVERL